MPSLRHVGSFAPRRFAAPLARLLVALALCLGALCTVKAPVARAAGSYTVYGCAGGAGYGNVDNYYGGRGNVVGQNIIADGCNTNGTWFNRSVLVENGYYPWTGYYGSWAGFSTGGIPWNTAIIGLSGSVYPYKEAAWYDFGWTNPYNPHKGAAITEQDEGDYIETLENWAPFDDPTDGSVNDGMLQQWYMGIWNGGPWTSGWQGFSYGGLWLSEIGFGIQSGDCVANNWCNGESGAYWANLATTLYDGNSPGFTWTGGSLWNNNTVSDSNCGGPCSLDWSTSDTVGTLEQRGYADGMLFGDGVASQGLGQQCDYSQEYPCNPGVPNGAIDMWTSYYFDDGGHSVEMWAQDAGNSAASVSSSFITDNWPPSAAGGSAVSGTPEVGQWLSVSNGNWNQCTSGDGQQTNWCNNNWNFGYQWYRCVPSPWSCSAVAGATASTYPLGWSDEGYVMDAETYLCDPLSGCGTQNWALSAQVYGYPPTNTSPTAIGGTPVVGQTLSLTSWGGWANYVSWSPSIQWLRNGAAIPGATGTTYALGWADEYTNISMRVTLCNPGNLCTSATSNSEYIIGDPINTAAPAIGGTPVVGNTLSLTSWGGWSSYISWNATVQWLRNGQPTGDSATTYATTWADQNTNISLQVSVCNPGNLCTSATSNSEYVTGYPPVNGAPPTISGTLLVGQTLSASPGSWSSNTNWSYAYAWYTCTGSSCAYTGDSSTTFTPSWSNYNQTVYVQVSLCNPGSLCTYANSAQTAPIPGYPPRNTVAPSISGTLLVGQTLSANPGGWSNNLNSTFSYAWYTCTGSSCAYTGDSSTTFTPSWSNYNQTVYVQVSLCNYTLCTPANSAQTATVPGYPPASSALPIITGVAKAGRTLSASTGTWTPSTLAPSVTYTYQWQACNSSGTGCSNVGVASPQNTFQPSWSMVGDTIRVVVTATNNPGSYSASSPPSAQTARVEGYSLACPL